jgi:hypothetical protein
MRMLAAFLVGSLLGCALSWWNYQRSLRRISEAYQRFLPHFLRPPVAPEVSTEGDRLVVRQRPNSVRRGRFCLHTADGTVITFARAPTEWESVAPTEPGDGLKR